MDLVKSTQELSNSFLQETIKFLEKYCTKEEFHLKDIINLITSAHISGMCNGLMLITEGEKEEREFVKRIMDAVLHSLQHNLDDKLSKLTWRGEKII